MRFPEERVEGMLGLLEKLVTRLRARGSTRVVLVECTRHPRVLEMRGEVEVRYRKVMEEFARRMNLDYLQLGEEAAVKAEDFHDWGHISSPDARRRYQAALVQHLARVLEPLNP